MFSLCSISEQENGIWSFSLMFRDLMTGLKLFAHCSVTPLKIGYFAEGKRFCLGERVICSKLYCLE